MQPIALIAQLSFYPLSASSFAELCHGPFILLRLRSHQATLPVAYAEGRAPPAVRPANLHRIGRLLPRNWPTLIREVRWARGTFPVPWCRERTRRCQHEPPEPPSGPTADVTGPLRHRGLLPQRVSALQVVVPIGWHRSFCPAGYFFYSGSLRTCASSPRRSHAESFVQTHQRHPCRRRPQRGFSPLFEGQFTPQAAEPFRLASLFFRSVLAGPEGSVPGLFRGCSGPWTSRTRRRASHFATTHSFGPA